MSNPEYEAVTPHIAARAEQDMAAKIAGFRAQSEAAGVLTTVKVRRGDERHTEIVEEARAQGAELLVLRQNAQRSLLSGFLASEAVVNGVVAHGPCDILVVPREARIWSTRLLVAVDAASQDSRMVAVAIGIALQWNLPLHLVAVITDEKQREGALAVVKALQDQAEQSGVAAACEVRQGEPTREILASLESTHSDVIIMGSCGEKHSGRSQMGGVARKVLVLSKHPVLVVRA
jgi:nucleotide-binding universal stress UspA family protein